MVRKFSAILYVFLVLTAILAFGGLVIHDVCALFGVTELRFSHSVGVFVAIAMIVFFFILFVNHG